MKRDEGRTFEEDFATPRAGEDVVARVRVAIAMGAVAYVDVIEPIRRVLRTADDGAVTIVDVRNNLMWVTYDPERGMWCNNLVRVHEHEGKSPTSIYPPRPNNTLRANPS
jgi:hypothetical protein